jgi:membrane protease YdiL (CAAX protease family)
MAELFLFAIPSVIYFLVQSRAKRLGRTEAARRLGLTRGTGRDYLLAAALLVPLVGLGYLAVSVIPEELSDAPGVVVASVTTLWGGIAVVARVTGEEILFRGLIGGVLMRRLGFAVGNLVQAGVFLLPHLTLLAIDVATWPILPVQFAAGWVLGWLRHRSGSILPGVLVHVLANLVAGLLLL